jgi:hypothetical protein
MLPRYTPLPATILVRDLAGRVVRQLEVDAPEGTLDISGLSRGSYLLEVPALGPASAVRFMIE